MYDVLATHYDSLVKDSDATKQYVSFVERYTKGHKAMELACGSGEISLLLAEHGFALDASDLSVAMLEVAKQKDVHHLVHYHQMDMRDMQGDTLYDTILCFCDSMNYLEVSELEAMFTSIYHHLQPDGVWLFDMHSLDRLSEFADEFYEEGIVDGVAYVWSIHAEDRSLYHTFVFYDERGNAHYEYHVQNVFDPIAVKDLLIKIGFQVSIYTDFDSEGIVAGEKYFYVCRKDTI